MCPRAIIFPFLYSNMLRTLEPPHKCLVVLSRGLFRVRDIGAMEGVRAAALADNLAFDALIHLLQERGTGSQQKLAIR